MITEDALETLLTEAAAGIDLPLDGAERALAAYRSGAEEPRVIGRSRARPRGLRPALAVAASFLVVTGVVALVQHHPSGGGGSPASTGAVASSPGLVNGRIAPAVRGDAPATTSGPQAAANAASPPTSGTGEVAPVGGPAPEVGAARVVHTANATIQVPAAQVAPTLARLRTLAAGMRGYVEASRAQLAGPAPTGTVTLRVPAAAYDRTRDALAGLGTVTDLTETGQDVTAQYADLTAQETALRTTRDALLALKRQARTVTDVLAVEARLTDVQSHLDVLEGQRKLLADTSAESTLTVSVTAPGRAPSTPHTRAGWSAAGYDFGHGAVVLLQGLLAAAGVTLTLFALAAVVVLAGLGLRRVWRRRGQ